MSSVQKDMKKYITFDDLEFVAHKFYSDHGVTHAEVGFENGWGVSVVRGEYATDGAEFEIAVVRDGKLDYSSEITDDVRRFDSVEELNACLRDIQDLDENGKIRRPNDRERADAKRHIEQRKAQISKARMLRLEIAKRHPEEKISNVALADEIAADKISGKEKRTITPEVGAEIRRRKVFERNK